MRVLVLIGLAAFLGPSWAAVYNTRDGGILVQDAVQRGTWVHQQDQAWNARMNLERSMLSPSPTAGPGSVVVVDKYKGPSPKAGEVIDVNVKRHLPWANISRAVAKSLPLISTALAIAEIAESIRCREAPGGGSECDPGTVETTQTQWCVLNGSLPAVGNYCAATKGGAHAAMLAAFQASSLPCGGTNTCFDYRITSCDNDGARCIYERRSAYGSNPYGPFGFFDQKWANSSDQLACPPVVVNGVTLYPVKGPDGKCMTNVYSPASEDAVAQKVEDYGDKTKAPLIVGDLSAAGQPVEHPHPEIDPVPDSIVGPRETTTHPDGSTTIRDTRWDLAPTPTGYEWTPSVIVKDYPPGAVIPPPGAVVDGTTTTGAPPKEDPITCGLPNTPPCKIDETGTPASAQITKAEVDASRQSALDKIGEIGNIQAPAWTWSFALPSSCSTIVVGPFLSQSVEVDLCQYQAMIHDLVSLIWAAFTVWACIGMVGRTFAAG